MNHVTAVMLIGGIRRSTLEIATGCRPACLPLESGYTLFAAWAARIADVDCRELRVVTSVECSTDELRSEETIAASRHSGLKVINSIESSTHRGTGGLLRDATADLAADEQVLVIEPHCLPPRSLRPLARAHQIGSMSVGVARLDAPAGACLVCRSLLEQAPRIGYHDFKEQFVPLLVGRGIPVRGVSMDASGLRVHSLHAYLAAIEEWSRAAGPSVSASADVGRSARVLGHSIVDSGAQIGGGAVILDSVVLPGAVVGAGAMVARSLVPRGFRVAPRSLLVDRVLDGAGSEDSGELVALGSGEAE